MPKEQINRPTVFVHRKDSTNVDTHDGSSVADGETLSADLGLSLHWDKHQGNIAQFAVEVDIEQLRALLKMVDDHEYMGDTFLTDTPRVRLYSGHLSRYEMQRLIKVARQARDDVFDPDA